MSEISRELLQLQKEWKRSKAKTRKSPLPEGEYTFEIIESKIGRSKNMRLQHVMSIQVVSPKNLAGRTIPRYTGLDTEGGLSWFKADIKALGLKVPKKIVNISRVIEECIGLTFEGQIKRNGDFTNIYINKLVETEALDTDQDEDVEEDIDEEEDE